MVVFEIEVEVIGIEDQAGATLKTGIPFEQEVGLVIDGIVIGIETEIMIGTRVVKMILEIGITTGEDGILRCDLIHVTQSLVNPLQ